MPFRDYAFLRDHTVVTEVITALDEQRAWWKKIMTSMHGLRGTEFFVNIGHPLFMSSDNLGIRFNGEPGSDAGALTRELYGLVFKRWIYSSAEDKKDQEEKDGDDRHRLLTLPPQEDSELWTLDAASSSKKGMSVEVWTLKSSNAARWRVRSLPDMTGNNEVDTKHDGDDIHVVRSNAGPDGKWLELANGA